MNPHYEQYKDTIQETTKQWLGKHQEVRLFHSCKANARKRGISFELKIEDIQIPTTCVFLGIPITNIYGQGRQQTNASIDRIDSTKGYTPDNIQVISDLANRMKQEATPEQLIKFANNILAMYRSPYRTSINS